MPVTPPRQGQIVLAWVPSPQGGGGKVRPLVVVHPDGEVGPDGELIGAAVTTTYADPPPPSHIELPWDNRRHRQTGLNRRAAAVTDWLVRFHIDRIERILGAAPERQLTEILERVHARVQRMRLK